MSNVSGLSIVDVAFDAMGGDGGPAFNVEAGLRAAKRGIRVALVGDQAIIEARLEALGGRTPNTLRVVHAPDSIAMDEKPSSAVRKKRDASICVAARLVASGDARSLLSAGNSGAVMASALFDIGRIPGVQRPAIGAVLPTRKGKTVIVDLGANIDPTPVQLAQFAVMGEAYARVALGQSRPRVALLANGSEEQKGSDLTRAAHEILEQCEFDYRGYCEGRDIFEGELDVIVTDGFTGNVLLKTLEGFVSAVRDIVERQIRSSVFATAGAVLLKDVFRKVKDKLDYEQAGAAPLLGIQKRCLVAHGGSSINALTNAIVTADKLAGTRLVETIEESIARHADKGLWPQPKKPRIEAVPEAS